MKTLLRPGAELESVTPDELRRELDSLRLALTRKPAVVRGDEGDVTSAAGALTLEFYKPPPGMLFRLTKLIVLADGFTPVAVFNAAGAFLELLREGTMIEFQSLVAGSGGSLPFEFVEADSMSSAHVYLNGESAAIRLTAGPASTNVLARFQGILEPVVEGN